MVRGSEAWTASAKRWCQVFREWTAVFAARALSLAPTAQQYWVEVGQALANEAQALERLCVPHVTHEHTPV